jgi:DNA-binding SARP family transcriptional activator
MWPSLNKRVKQLIASRRGTRPCLSIAAPLLPHLYDDWLWEWRAQLHQQWLTAMQEVVDRATAVDKTSLAIHMLEQLIEAEPLREKPLPSLNADLPRAG